MDMIMNGYLQFWKYKKPNYEHLLLLTTSLTASYNIHCHKMCSFFSIDAFWSSSFRFVLLTWQSRIKKIFKKQQKISCICITCNIKKKKKKAWGEKVVKIDSKYIHVCACECVYVRVCLLHTHVYFSRVIITGVSLFFFSHDTTQTQSPQNQTQFSQMTLSFFHQWMKNGKIPNKPLKSRSISEYMCDHVFHHFRFQAISYQCPIYISYQQKRDSNFLMWLLL